MFQNNPLLASLKAKMQEDKVFVEGFVQATDKNFGFLRVKNESYFIDPSEMKNLLGGDKIKASLETDGDRQKIKVEQLLESAFENFMGRVCFHKDGRLQVELEDGNTYKKMPARKAKDLRVELKEGDIVSCRLTHHPVRDQRFFSAQIERLVCSKDDPFMPWWITLNRFNQPKEDVKEFDDLVLETVERVDLTHKNFITIDSTTTLDMDDAICVELLENGNFELSVAIADPTAYISEHHQVDQIAKERAFTNYLPSFNVPMLPRSLADDLCSLKEHQKRPVLVGIMQVNQQGELVDTISFVEAIIESKARLNYDEVANYLDDKNTQFFEDNQAIREQIDNLKDFAQARNSWREKNSLTFDDLGDYSFKVDEQGTILDIVLMPRGTAHKAVEEAMILANSAVGDFFEKHQTNAIFNTHLGFKEENLEKVCEYVNTIFEKSENEALSVDDAKSFEGYVKLMQQARATSYYIDRNLRRFLTFAEFKKEKAEHFGLGLESYATWTSPIRKYSDMVNHRVIKSIIRNGEQPKVTDELIEHLQIARKTNRLVEREVKNWLYAIYYSNPKMQQSEYEAEIFNISNAGIRVKLINTGAMVFIAMKDAKVNLDNIKVTPLDMMLLEDGKKRYQLGDRVQVRITNVVIDDKNILGTII